MSRILRPTRHASLLFTTRRWKVALVTILAGAVTFVATGVASAYYVAQQQITRVDNTALLGTDRPTRATPTPAPLLDIEEREEVPTQEIQTSIADPFPGQALNILVMGSDIRDGENETLGGGGEGMRSDTAIIAHISADRENVELVSIPRDSWVDIPTCERADGTFTTAQTTKFNAAFSYGALHGEVGSGAACTIRTIEQLTGVYIDGWAVIDFSGFVDVVDALGGVTINIDHYINSPKANGLVLEAGEQKLDGVTALSYARARSGEGLNGADFSRIERQQKLFSAIIDKAAQQYTNVPSLIKFVTTSAGTLTASEEFGKIDTLAGLAFVSRDADITFTTVPWVERGDGANLLWTTEADTLWERLIHDTPPGNTQEATEEPTS